MTAARPEIEFFRVDRSPRTRRLLTSGAILIALGTIGISTNFIHRIPREIASFTTFGGALILIFGLFMSFASMGLMVLEDHYVAVREDALVMHRNESEQTVPWSDIEAFGADGEALLVRLKSGGEIRWFMGQAVVELAEHLEQQRAKAMLGLLKGN